MNAHSKSHLRYRTIVADPPWQVKTGPSWGKNDKTSPLNPRSHDLTYPTIPLEDLYRLPVRELADSSCHLYVWTINRYVEATYELVRWWGFKPSTLLTWVKQPKGIGLGGTFALASEFILFARRGSLPSQSRIDRNWWDWPRSTHSKKPEAFLDIIESVSPGPYLELFARRQRLGWDTWGNQALEHVAMEAV